MRMLHLTLGFALALVAHRLASGDEIDGMRDHARFHQFYKDWTDARGASCCNNSDCAPVQYRTGTETQYEIFVGGIWWKVPNDKILKKDSPDGNAHACIPSYGGRTPTERIKCFVPGSLI